MISINIRNIAKLFGNALSIVAFLGISYFGFTSVAFADYYATYTYTTSGTFIVPAGVTNLTVDITGAGGGGAGGAFTYGGGGGGAGASIPNVLMAVTPGQSVPYIIGAGGNGGTTGSFSSAGGRGGNGGTTFFGFLIFANGGNGGNGAIVGSTNGGQGGTSGGFNGTNGTNGDSFVGQRVKGGSGGTNPFGTGGNGGTGNSSSYTLPVAGTNGNGGGAGSGWAYNANPTTRDAGARGGDGVIRVSYYADLTAPVITIIGANPITIPANTVYTDLGATALDNTFGPVPVTIIFNNVNISATGTYSVVYSATDGAGNIATSSRTVIVTDQAAPVITAPIDQTFEATSATTTPILVLATAIDSIDPNPVITYSPASFALGTTTVIWTATDSAGNFSTTTSLVIIKDTTPPAIVLNGSSTLSFMASTTQIYIDLGATAFDLVDGTSTVTTIFNNVNLSATGTYSVVYSSTDLTGNTGTSSRTVIVTPQPAPVLTSISISPLTPLVTVGTSLQFTSTTLDQYGNPFAASVIWVSSNNTVGTINPSTGLFNGLSNGTTTVTAFSGALSTSTLVTVSTSTPVLPINLLSAANFVILSKAGITDVPTSTIIGNVGTTPITGASITGLTCPEVTGTIYDNDTAYTGNPSGTLCLITDASLLNIARLDMESAYTNAAGQPAGVGPNLNIEAGIVSTQTLGPGTYTWNTPRNVTITGDITLSGTATDVWVFQISGTLDIQAGKQIILTGGALPQNVFWQVAGAVTLLPGSHVEGNILAQTNIAMQNGATLRGRALAQTAVTLDQNTVTIPSTPVPDTTAPTIPTITSASATGTIITSADISWTDSTDTESGLSGYLYLYDANSGTIVSTTTPGVATTSATTTSSVNFGTVWFHVAAIDNAGNISSTTSYGPFIISDSQVLYKNSTVGGTFYTLFSPSLAQSVVASTTGTTTLTNSTLSTFWNINDSILYQTNVNDTNLNNVVSTSSDLTNSDITNCTIIFSTVKNYFATNCYIAFSFIDPTTTYFFINSTSTYSQVYASNIYYSTIANSYVATSTITASTLSFSTSTSSTIATSTITSSTIASSIVASSTLTYVLAASSTIIGTTIIGTPLFPVILTNASIINGYISAGFITIGGITYGPFSTSTLISSLLAPTLTSISISPLTPTVTVGSSTPFTSITLDQFGAVFATTTTWTSSSSTIGTIDPAGLFTGVSAGTVTITGTAGTLSTSTLVTVSTVPATLSSVTIVPLTPTVTVGATTTFTSAPLDQYGNPFATSTSWTSSSSTIGTIDPVTGVFTALSAGTTTVTGTAGTFTDSTVVTVTSAVTLTSITITTPANVLTYTVGQALDITGLVVTGTYSDASTSTQPITPANITGFNSSVPVVGQILTITVGTSTTTYTIDINAVIPPALSSISILPSNPSVMVGATTSFISMPLDQFGNPFPATTAWNSSDNLIGTIDSAGLFTAVSAGTVTVTGTAGAFSASTTVIVTSGLDTTAPVMTLNGPSPMNLILGGAVYFEYGAMAIDNVDGDISASVSIDSSAFNPAATGTYPIIYSVSDLAGNSSSSTRTVIVNDNTYSQPPVIALNGSSTINIVATTTPYVDQGATAFDLIDGDITALIVTTGTSTVDTSTPNTYFVSYDVSNATGTPAVQVTRTINVTVAVIPPALSSISILPSNPSVMVGVTTSFISMPLDQFGNPFPATTAWNSSDNLIGTIDSAGLFTAVSAGTVTVTGTAGAFSASTTITVFAPTLTSISISPLTPTVTVGSTTPFTSITLDQFGNPFATTTTWTSSNLLIGTINSSGVFTALSAGTTTVTGTAGTFTDSTVVTVTSVVVPPALASITISPLTPSVTVGATRLFVPTTLDQYGAPFATTTNWNSSNPLIGTINAGGLFTALSAGTTTITGTAGTFSALTVITVSNVVVAPSGGGGGFGGGWGPIVPVSTSTATSTIMIGDINGDGKVNKYDFSLLMFYWGDIGQNIISDLNIDGIVNKFDFALLMANWGK